MIELAPGRKWNWSNFWQKFFNFEFKKKIIFSAAGATKNLRRFGQSIKRVVREVKEESTGEVDSATLLRELVKQFRENQRNSA